jgi:hypothetical protein
MTAVQQLAEDQQCAQDRGERQAIQLADRLRALAKTDPELAQHLVEELIEKLNTATEGLFDEYLDKHGERTVPNQGGTAETPARNS